MVNAWEVGTIVAVVAGVVGFFTVLRGSAFAAHAIPNGSFAGAAGASLVGLGTLFGLGVFAFLSALGIGLLGRRGRHDAVTALMLVMMLALGSLFVSFSSEYAPELYSLLFCEVLGISANAVLPTLILGALCLLAIAVLYRPLMVSSALPEVGEARGSSVFVMELCSLGVLALAPAMTVPVVGTLLIFSLMIGAPAAARSFTDRPWVAMALSVVIALAVVWVAVAMSYETAWRVGFCVGTASAAVFVAARLWAVGRERYSRRRAPGGRGAEGL